MKQILKTLVETMTLPEDSYLEQDAEILEIFIEELDEIFVELEPLLIQWTEQPHQQHVLTDIRRHFHTLKGSGRMVGAKSSGELAWTVEDTLNRVIAGTITLNADIQRYVQTVFNLYRFKLAHDFKAVQAHQVDFKPLVLLGQQLQQQQSPEPALAALLNLAIDLNHEQGLTGLERVDDAVVETDVLEQAPQQAEPVSELELAAPFEDEALAKETLAIFQEEAEEHLATINQFLQNDHPSNDQYNTLIRALHTLRGSSAMAHVDHVFEASSKVENLFKTLLQEELDSSSDETALLTHYAQFVGDYLHTLKHAGSPQKLNEIYETFNVAWDGYDFQLEEKHGDAVRPQGLVSQLIELEINDLLDVEFDFEKRARHEFPQYIQLLSQQAEILLQHTHHHATIGMYQYTSLLRSSYQDLIFKPSLLHLDYAFELYHQVHQQFIQLFDTLAAGQRVTLTKAHERVLNELSSFTQQNVESVQQEPVVAETHTVEETLAIEPQATSSAVTDLAAQFALDKQQLDLDEANRDFDPDLLDIFLEEADELLAGIDTDLSTWAADHNNVDALKNLMRYLHTLKGGSNMIQARHIGLISHELESIYEKLINQQIQATPALIAVIRAVQDDIADRIQIIRDQQVDYPATHALAVLHNLEKTTLTATQADFTSATPQRVLETVETEAHEHAVETGIAGTTPANAAIDVTAFAAQLALDKQQLQSAASNRDFDPDLLDIFLEEADELLAGIDTDLNTWTADHHNLDALKNLMRYLHTLKGGSNMIQARHIGLIAHELESLYEKLINQHIQATPQLVAIIRLAQDDIADRIQTIRDQQTDYPSTHVVQLLQQADQTVVPAMLEPVIEPVETLATIEVDVVEAQSEVPELAEVEAQPDTQTLNLQPESSDVASDEIRDTTSAAQSVETVAASLDDDVRSLVEQTFLEEAEELLEQAQSLLKQWFEQRGNRSLLLQLQRNAHSLKGGARMAEMDAIAVIAYHLENAFEQFGVHHFNSNVYDNLLNTALAWLHEAIFKRQYANFDGLKQSLEKMEFVDVSAQLPQKLSARDIFTPEYTMEFVQGDGTEPPSMLGEWETTERIEQNNEMIRVSADVIEKMIDLSGENAINRSRIEMDLGQLGGTLTEMELAIKRLADQLRRMEGELESQIIARHGGEDARYADFDPLEMDQYSSLNQLSKSLAESASDLVDFKTTLSEKIRDTEGLLLQQSRIQAEIQESLMRTRLVPFSRLLPRLQRIVRQTASALNRPTELVVNNTEGELDRSILERLVAPFEHMLRNAIDHGIEDREQRLQAKKPETGHIVLNIGRQGTDVVVTFSDDGKGIDVNRIKEKALQTGLMTPDQKLEQEEILQFIFHPGFSTAAQVTQISGRGVGLDVVQSDIKALGGHVSVDSRLGTGTTFTIRVPTTVAVSDALMVKAGDQQFAFPLAQIDRIVRISPMALEQYFDSQDDYFTIDQERYRLRYLSEFVAGQPIPRLSGVVHSLPVLLIKGAQGQTTALLVDQLIGSRGQIVVKPVGQQFSSIGVIAGATILGDGQVCLILDGQNIARQAQSTARSKQADETYTKQRYDERRLIMIVDDSVTVRKVTSRLLERQGYDVVTAKDGVDAMEQLETVKPDLMLLDIEMPRMDGFEVTNLVRHHELHRDLPIIMITSRTGEKHRERALSLGVSQYMGKPFQEEALLENIETLLAVR
ncbi:Hpt domain-containing protein [Acinetobacter calcoaceticus]|uniref:hybrid sensor histidine kinase/response regulator n=1 Tax=Acinetobacter calcoaceticus TaxID=471 RepID=UPI002B2ADE79|nr:Hpt domain-containing protein [Acinetobacter baumannii]